MTSEDEMVNQLIQTAKQTKGGTVDCVAECHYNHYGQRGVVDLVVEYHYEHSDLPEIGIYEVKSDYAIDSVTGANEIIRQFNRHQEAFFAGTDYVEGHYYGPHFHLAFNATDKALAHIRANESMYRSAEQNGDSGEKTASVRLFDIDSGAVGHPLQKLEMSDNGEVYWHQEWDFADILTDARPLAQEE